jgi:signal peptide peptidase SppA
MLRLLAAFYNTPWALDPTTLGVMAQLLDRWALGVRLSDADIEAAVGSAPELAAQRREATAQASAGAVGVVPVYGVLAHRAYSVQNVSSPLTSTERLAQQVRSFGADPAIGSIVLDVDSPGGSVFGVQELGDAIASVRGSKPVIAVANSMAASGGYWIASQADEVVVTPSGMVGSIGVIVPHADLSAAYEKAGVKKTFITAGKYKAEGNDTGPLDDEARVSMQQMVDDYYVAFTKAVAKGRGIGVDRVRGPDFGEGRMKLAKDAVASGMADKVGTLEETIARMSRTRRAGGMSAHTADRDIQILEA